MNSAACPVLSSRQHCVLSWTLPGAWVVQDHFLVLVTSASHDHNNMLNEASMLLLLMHAQQSHCCCADNAASVIQHTVSLLQHNPNMPLQEVQ